MLTDDLLDGAKEIGGFLRKSPRQTYHLIEAGHIPVIRLGRRIYARKSELEAAFRSAVA